MDHVSNNTLYLLLNFRFEFLAEVACFAFCLNPFMKNKSVAWRKLGL